MSYPVKIAIADDHMLFRKGLASILAEVPEFEVVFEAEHGASLLANMDHNLPDVVLLDLKMPVKDGIETTIELKQQYPAVKVIVLSMYEEDDFVLRMFRMGANAYLLKNAEPKQVIEAVKSVYEKGNYFTERVSQVLAKELTQKPKNDSLNQNGPELTPREVEVVKLITREFTNQQIGDILNLSARTVEGHRKRIQNKLGAKNMAGIIVYAARHGLID